MSKSEKKSKAVQIHKEAVTINNIKSEIDTFGGNRSHARYKDLQKILVNTSIKIQDLKVKTHKQHNRDYCKQIHGQIQQCIQRLESKASFNSKKDIAAFNIDRWALPENETLSEITEDDNCDWAWHLTELEEECEVLERDLKGLLDSGNIRQMYHVEKKIRALYRQLEMISVKSYTPLGDKKLDLGKRLIKCNNQIKKVKRNIKRKTKSFTNLSFRENSDDLVLTVEDQVVDLETSVLSFEGTTSDDRYNELQQSMEWQKINLHRISNDTAESRHRSSLLINKIDELMQHLQQKAEAQGNRLSLSVNLLEQVKAFKGHWNNLDAIICKSGEAANVFERVADEIDDLILKIRFLHAVHANPDSEEVCDVDNSKASPSLNKIPDDLKELESSQSDGIRSENTERYPKLLGSEPAKLSSVKRMSCENGVVPPEISTNPPAATFQHLPANADELKILQQQVNLLKQQVQNVNCVYKDDVFNELDGNLKVCSKNLDCMEFSDESLQRAKKHTQKEVGSCLAILESKLLQNRCDNSLDTKVETSPPQPENNNPSFKLTETHTNHQIERYFYSPEAPDPIEELASVENEISSIKVAIAELNASSLFDNDGISQTIKSCIIKIEAIDAGNVMFVCEQKRQLLGELRDCEKVLRDKLADYKEHDEELCTIRTIMERLASIETEVDNFQGRKGDQNYNRLDEVLVAWMVKLNNIQTYGNKSVEVEKRNGIQAILKNIRVLSRKATE